MVLDPIVGHPRNVTVVHHLTDMGEPQGQEVAVFPLVPRMVIPSIMIGGQVPGSILTEE